MTLATPVGCARCGTILEERFRFCPECGLPVSGEGVLSTEIADLRRHVEARAREDRSVGWRRYLLPTAATVLFAFVVGLGLVLFNRPLLNRLLPPPEPPAQPPQPPSWEPDWRTVPAGTFPYGDPTDERRATVPYAFQISTYEVTNNLWFQFISAERKRLVEIGLWQESFPQHLKGWKLDPKTREPLLDESRRTHPIAAVSPSAIAEFCVWLTHRLNKPGVQIRMPTQFEWEYAARGAGPEPRMYPWGNDDVEVAPFRTGGTPHARWGIDSETFPVDAAQLRDDDQSPFGVVAMGTNVSEWTVMPDLAALEEGPDAPEVEDPLPATPLREAMQDGKLKVAWRGASAACGVATARRVARCWDRAQSERTDMKYDVGIRLVKVRSGK